MKNLLEIKKSNSIFIRFERYKSGRICTFFQAIDMGVVNQYEGLNLENVVGVSTKKLQTYLEKEERKSIKDALSWLIQQLKDYQINQKQLKLF